METGALKKNVVYSALGLEKKATGMNTLLAPVALHWKSVATTVSETRGMLVKGWSLIQIEMTIVNILKTPWSLSINPNTPVGDAVG
jgi:hypothetical protein